MASLYICKSGGVTSVDEEFFFIFLCEITEKTYLSIDIFFSLILIHYWCKDFYILRQLEIILDVTFIIHFTNVYDFQLYDNLQLNTTTVSKKTFTRLVYSN